MKAADAIALLKKTTETESYNIKIPSTGETVKFKPLTIDTFKEITKIGFQSPAKLHEALADAIEKLSEGAVKRESLIQYDLTSIFILLKANNVLKEDFRISFECDNLSCGQVLKSYFDVNNLYKERIEGPKEYEVQDSNTGSKIKVVLGEPTVKDNIEFDKNVKTRTQSFLTLEEKQTFQLYIAAYENYMLFIKEIYVNDEKVEDFGEMSIMDRIKFLNNFNHAIINSEKINNYTKTLFENMAVEKKCENCDTHNRNIISPTDFLII
jgi:hypothetical protein